MDGAGRVTEWQRGRLRLYVESPRRAPVVLLVKEQADHRPARIRLLSVTENYRTETFQLPFKCRCQSVVVSWK